MHTCVGELGEASVDRFAEQPQITWASSEARYLRIEIQGTIRWPPPTGWRSADGPTAARVNCESVCRSLSFVCFVTYLCLANATLISQSDQTRPVNTDSASNVQSRFYVGPNLINSMPPSKSDVSS